MDGWEALADEHGLFSTVRAVSAGFTAADLRSLVRADQIVRLDRGWYALSDGQTLDIPSSWEKRRRFHALRARAVVRAYEHQVVASHHSALVLRSLPVFAADLRQVHVTRVDSGQFRRRPGLTVHERIPGIEAADGVIDVASAIMGTARENGQIAALIAADAALHRRQVTLHDLATAADQFVGPSSAPCRRVVELADGRAESPGETRLREAFRLMGLTAIPQYPIHDGPFLAVIDFYLEEYRLAIEFDGFVKYGRQNPLTTQPAPADVVTAEKVREDHVRELGHGFLRVIWRDMDNLRALRWRVDRLIHRGAAHRTA
jgi:hypothetical protein